MEWACQSQSTRHCLQIPIFIFLLASCNAPQKVINSEKYYAYECRNIVSSFQMDTLALNDLQSDTILSGAYTMVDMYLAKAFGIIDHLKRYEILKQEISKDGEKQQLLTELFSVSNYLNESADLAALEIQSLTDFIECTNLKLGKFKALVSKANQRSQNRLSTGAIVVGAVASVLTASVLVSKDEDLKNSSFFDWLAVASGVATAYLAIRSNRVDKKVQLDPGKNLIKAIWTNNNDEQLFPAPTWYLLNQKIEVDNNMTSLREIIIYEWKNAENMLADPKHMEYLPILLADKGVYNEQMIDLRMDMMAAISIGLDQINRALYLFNARRR
jgi:hypothetical protein